jgi:hypothetical protein
MYREYFFSVYLLCHCREFYFNPGISCFKFQFLFLPADIISCVEFNHDGDLLATGDKGGRVVIFQRDPIVSI